MRTPAELAIATLESGRHMLLRHVEGLTLEDALQAAGGYRSILGILKHVAGWTHVYYSYAFEAEPRHWQAADWPRGMRDTIDAAPEYLREIIAWYEEGAERWLRSLADESLDLDYLRRCHWGATAPLFDIVLMVAGHWWYHTGEINQVLAVARGAAWEYTEEVEENHIHTAGHRLRPDWMSDEQARRYEAYMAVRDAQLRGT
jgi:hypothetical protein